MIDYGLEPKLKEIFDYLSSKSKEAYKDIYLLSNETLSKNPFSSSFVRDFVASIADEQPPIGKFVIAKRLSLYYLKNSIVLCCYLFNCMVYKIFFNKKLLQNRNLVVIDTFFMTDKILASKKFSDGYMPGLDSVLEKRSIPFLYLARFYGAYSPTKMFRVFKYLKDSQTGYVCDFDFLSVSDLFKLVIFYLGYPFGVLRFVSTLGDDRSDKLLKKSMISGLSDVSFTKYARYLVGKNFKRLKADRVRLISWFENQTVDKNLYAGVRQSNIDCYIVGVQAFLFAKTYLSALVDEAQIGLGCVPDKILVNGIAYLPFSSSARFEVGPSFRYKKLFGLDGYQNMQKDNNTPNILIILSFDEKQNAKMLSCFDGIEFGFEVSISVKPHQDLKPDSYVKYVERIFGAKMVDSDIYTLFASSDLIVGASSGSLIEALSFGVNVLQFSSGGFEYKILDGYGKGIFWDDFYNRDDLSQKVDLFLLGSRAKDKNSIVRYYSNFFSEPTEDNIVSATLC